MIKPSAVLDTPQDVAEWVRATLLDLSGVIGVWDVDNGGWASVRTDVDLEYSWVGAFRLTRAGQSYWVRVNSGDAQLDLYVTAIHGICDCTVGGHDA